MPNKFIEMLLGAVTGAITTVGTQKLTTVLDQLHKDDPESYKAAIHAGHTLVIKLQPLVDKSPTEIDNSLLSALGQAVVDSARTNGVTL